METKLIKSHGMTSEKASRIKVRGHNKEYMYSVLMKGKMVPGTKKEDVIDLEGKVHSLKGGSEILKKAGRDGKWQMFLYKRSRFEREMEFPARDIILNIFDQFPLTHAEYEARKVEIKRNLTIPMTALKENLMDADLRRKFFNKSFFDDRVNYFVVYDDDYFYAFDRDEVIDIFINNLEVDNNSTHQKVVFKFQNKLVAEFEMRTTNDGKYPAILFNMQKRRAVDLLLSKTSASKDITQVIKAFGTAVSYFSNYKEVHQLI